ncbi:MAG: Na+/H+ antiporter subunit C [Alphaproteobacteria bacterium HGW-Alphaproteobacteria-12]|nr:MAG: Na+/H+ antiporter subunit C [Alphaproteobacteria bacterium HGW-Alphaproteobacteria-12]
MSEIVLDFEFFLGHYNYWLFVILMMTGLYVTVSRGNLIKKIVGLNLFQTSVFLLYISMGKIIGGTAPILVDDPETVYSNPLPHVLILTAIVVGIATTALALALVIRIRETYGTVEEDDILAMEHEMEFGAAKPPPGRGMR